MLTRIWSRNSTWESSILTEFRLDEMSVKDLLALRDRVDGAIRAAIARSRMETVNKPAVTENVVDLERERDAWAARKAINGNRQ